MNHLPRLGGHRPKMRVNLEFPIGSLNEDLCVGETLERQPMPAARTGEVDGNKCVRSIFLFDRNLDPTSVARNRDKERIENFICFNRDPGDTWERSFRGQNGGFSRHERFSALFNLKAGLVFNGQLRRLFSGDGRLVADYWRPNPGGAHRNNVTACLWHVEMNCPGAFQFLRGNFCESIGISVSKDEWCNLLFNCFCDDEKQIGL